MSKDHFNAESLFDRFTALTEVGEERAVNHIFLMKKYKECSAGLALFTPIEKGV